MKHKVKVKVTVEKRGLFGIKKTVTEIRTVKVDGKTYRKLKENCRTGQIDEMMLCDEIFEEWDN